MEKDLNLHSKDEDILFLIKILSKKLRAHFDKGLEQYGLTGQQGRCLFLIYLYNQKNVELHQNDIEKCLELSKSTVSGLIDRLESKELIRRIYEKQYTKLEPTEKGISIVDNIGKGREDTIKHLFKGFNEEEQSQVIQIVKKLIINLKEEDETCGIE